MTRDRDLCCSREELLSMAAAYLGGSAPRDPAASPLFGAFTGFPPLLAVVGSEEVLLDDTLRLVRAVGLAGGSAEAVIVAGMQHVFPIWVGVFPEADAAMSRVGAWLRALAS